MNDFSFYSPTEFVFGKGTENSCGKYVKKYGGSKVLIHYGSGYVVKSGLQKYINDDKELAGICEELSMLMKMYPKTHTQSWVLFSWGSMEFEGYITSMNISYKMFNRNGHPVRVEVDLEILGEDRNVLQTLGAKPRESPDRTKYRMLHQKNELWMLADEEYQDASCWKEIAKENGILNPRKVDYTKQLKVPSLQ